MKPSKRNKRSRKTDKRGSGLRAARGSADNVEDVINGLKHMADDHPCCKQSILKAITTLEAVMIEHCTICYSCACMCPPNDRAMPPETPAEAKSGGGVVLQRFVRWLRGQDWKESRVITADDIVYTVRDREGCERQICCASDGKWRKQSEVKFSRLPCFEQHHKAAYFAATPYSPNGELSDRASKTNNDRTAP